MAAAASLAIRGHDAAGERVEQKPHAVVVEQIERCALVVLGVERHCVAGRRGRLDRAADGEEPVQQFRQ